MVIILYFVKRGKSLFKHYPSLEILYICGRILAHSNNLCKKYIMHKNLT